MFDLEDCAPIICNPDEMYSVLQMPRVCNIWATANVDGCPTIHALEIRGQNDLDLVGMLINVY